MSIADVRFYVGDTEEPYLLTDSQIMLAIDATTGDMLAAALCARSLSARFAREADSRFETLWSYNSQKAAAFEKLARNLEQRAKLSGGLGTPVAGGISRADTESARQDTDRVRPVFQEGQFRNPASVGLSGPGHDE